jgi:hypothetical protein
MGHFFFFVFVVAACLLWSAAFTAAAARTQHPWLRRLLEAVAVLLPVFALAPFVWFTAFLAFGKHMPTNWFGPALTTFLSASIGGIWIAWAGLGWRWNAPFPFADKPMPPAARWPVIGLAAAFVMAEAVAFGTLLIIDNAVAAQAPYLRLEAAQLIQANLPPAVPDLQNAATFYEQALAALDPDPTFTLGEDELESPLTPAVAELLARHASTLDLLRRAAERDTCRFQRDWTRPSFQLLLTETQSLRTAARLLALAARREAADGNTADALQDVARIERIGHHAASEPILISNLIGIAIDSVALQTLAEVLPTLRKSDLAALDSSDIRDLVTPPSAMASHFYGEEAFDLSWYADLSDDQIGVDNLTMVLDTVLDEMDSSEPLLYRLLPCSILYRVFYLPADLAGYRSFMRKYQQLAAGSEPYPEVKKKTAAMETELRNRSPGMMSSLIVPALKGVFPAHARNIARHRAAAALVAATKQRLETGTVPETFEEVTAGFVPPTARDPFTADHSLLMKRTDDTVVVYSVGPDGEDDGGPVDDWADGNDDVGLWMAL